MVTVNVDIDFKGLRALKKRAGKLSSPMLVPLAKWATDIHREILLNLTGRKLKVVTGKLRAHQQFPEVSQLSANDVQAAFTNRTEYAAIHEFGGTTPAHIILPRMKKALKFNIGGRTIFARSVNHPGSTFKARRFMRDPIEEGVDKLKNVLEEAIVRHLNGE